VVEALLLLDEPLRATLILRFLEELPPRAVATRMGVPVETVRSRTRRGLEVLRERLDRSFGDRASWCSALLFLLRRPSAAEVLSTVLAVMSIPKKIALVVVLCALGWLAWPRRDQSTEPVTPLLAEAPAGLEVPPRDSESELVPAPVPAARATLPSATDDARHASAPFGSLRVRVTWFDGSPAEGIAVSARLSSGGNPELNRREGTTDRAGTVVVSAVPVGETSVVLDRGVYASATIEAGKETELELVIPRGFDLLGRVEDTDGAPIAGAEVWIAAHGELVDGTRAATTDASGSFRLRSLQSSTLVAACADGYRPSRSDRVSGEEGDDQTIRLVLRRGAGVVAGEVVDSLTEKPVPGAFVCLGSRESMLMGPWPRCARTDVDGRFRVIGLVPGACSVTVRKPGYALGRAETLVREGHQETVALALLPEAALEGHVLDEQGRAVSGVSVIVGQGVAWLNASDDTASDGSFHIGALEAGATLEARVLRRRDCIASTTFLSLPGQTHEWEARLGEMGVIRGRLLDEAERPLARWLVELDDSGAGIGQDESTAADGSFRFENVIDHPHRLDARIGLQYVLRLEGVRPSETELVLHVPADRLPSVRIVGTFLDERGQAIPGATAMPWYDNQASSEKIDDTSGRFELGPFPPGVFRLTLESPGGEQISLGPRDLAPGETWDCGVTRLAPAGRVVVRLQPEGIELGQDLWLRIRGENQFWRAEGLDGSNPLLRTAALPPGRYKLVVLGGDYAEVDVPFEIRSGEETPIEVPIRRGRSAAVAVSCDDPALTQIELSLTRAQDALAITRFLGRSKDGTFRDGLHLAPGAYWVEARAADRRADGELVVGPEDGGAQPTLELVLP
jgi:hypothetical protein